MPRKRTWLVQLRGNRSQREIAELLTSRGVPCSRQHYSCIELGLRDPNPRVAQELANLFGVSMEFIYFGPTSDSTSGAAVAGQEEPSDAAKSA